MDLLGWLRRAGPVDPAAGWRERWRTEIDGPDGPNAAALAQELSALGSIDLELEYEMLEGARELERLRRQVAQEALPVVETQHRVLGGETCHFSAPSSAVQGTAELSGRLLLTATRAVFVGNGRSVTTPWHAVREIARVDRQVVLARTDGSTAAEFRLNTYGDAVAVAFLARHFKAARSGRL